MKKHFKRRIFAVLIGCLILLSAFPAIAEVLPAGSVKRADYTFSADEIKDTLTGKTVANASGSAIQVRSSVLLSRGADLEISGWLETNGGVRGYQYAIDSTGGWREFSADDAVISDRTDVHPESFGYSGGDGTDGFRLTVRMAGQTVGFHDVFVRAVTQNGEYCEFLVLLNIQYGTPDTESGNDLNVGLGKYEGDGYITHKGRDAVSLTDGKTVKLGDLYNYSLFGKAKIRFETDSASGTLKLTADAAGGGKTYTAGLSEAKDGVITFDLSGENGRGGLYVSFDGGEMILTEVLLEYVDPPYFTEPYTFTLSESRIGYFTGGNHAAAESATDDTVGDHLRLTLSEDTNDPFITFVVENAAKAELGRGINANFHKYIVIRMMSPESNAGHNTFQLFLCAGGISGAREDSSLHVTAVPDGKWHSYIVDLSDMGFWTGPIHNFRFDFLEGANFPAGAYVELSSVTFCTTAEEAAEAANREYEKVYDEEAHHRESMFEEKVRSDVNTHINFFADADTGCFGGEHVTSASFGKYGDLILRGTTDDIVDPYVSFYISNYRGLHSQSALNASDYKGMVMRVLPNTADSGSIFELFYYTSDHGFAEGGYSVSAQYNNREEWQYLVFDFTDKPLWSGTIDGFRLDWTLKGGKGAEMAISDMWFFGSAEEALAFAEAQMPEETTVGETTAEESSGADETGAVTVGDETFGPGEIIETSAVVTDRAEETSDAEGSGSGCGTIVSGAAVILILAGAAAVGKKKEF